MFICAVPRPEFNDQNECIFDGKLGIWSFSEDTFAIRASKNRPKGVPVTKAITKVNCPLYKKFLRKFVVPAIKEKWPKHRQNEKNYAAGQLLSARNFQQLELVPLYCRGRLAHRVDVPAC